MRSWAEPDSREPEIEGRFREYKLPGLSVVVTGVLDKYWVHRFSVSGTAVALPCALEVGQARARVVQVLGSPGADYHWSREWCERYQGRLVTLAAHATLHLAFDGDGRLDRILWSYVAD